ncbi:MAG: hypothetical protein QMD12_02660 [Candidatus Aenigmarchaeota archaeon]|nr:hypothetical protein [Candidatus Aenigmarchaeota archaeon]
MDSFSEEDLERELFIPVPEYGIVIPRLVFIGDDPHPIIDIWF